MLHLPHQQSSCLSGEGMSLRLRQRIRRASVQLQHCAEVTRLAAVPRSSSCYSPEQSAIPSVSNRPSSLCWMSLLYCQAVRLMLSLQSLIKASMAFVYSAASCLCKLEWAKAVLSTQHKPHSRSASIKYQCRSLLESSRRQQISD